MRIGIVGALALATTSWLISPLATTAVANAVEASEPACTIVGTRGDDVLRGTRGADVICGGGGADRIHGRRGDDILRGGRGGDVVVGGPGDDALRGGPGADVLDGHDHWRNTDRLACGAGNDRATADARDKVDSNCEDADEGDPPTGIELTPAVVAENAPAGTVAGQLSATGSDPGDTRTFALVAGEGSTDNDAFTVDGTSLTTRGPLDHEGTPTLTVRIGVTTAAGNRFAAALTIEVTDLDEPADAVDDTATVTEDSASNTVEVLANDSDPDGPGDELAVASVTQPAHGRAAVAAGGRAVTYQPDPSYCSGPAADTFTYTLADGVTATVTVTVTCVDDAPMAVDDTAIVLEDAAATTLPVLTNDPDPDGGPRIITSVTQPASGTVVITGGGTGLTYAPPSGTCNDGTPTDDFTYTLAPGGSSAQVRVTVACVQEAPVATDDARTTDEDTPLSLPAGGPGSPVTNDTDADGDALTVTAVSGATGGTVALTAGTITFTPTADLCGADAGGFGYTVSDGRGGTDTGHVAVTLTCVADPAGAADDTATVAEDATATALDVVANDEDPDGDAITIISVTQPGLGTVAITGGGTGLTYTPDPDACTPVGTDDFTYTVNGGSTADVEVTVTCSPDAPVLVTTAGATGYTENDPAVVIDAGLTVDDVDPGAEIDGATVTISEGFVDGEDVLSLTGTHTGIIAVLDGDTLTLSGTASPAAYQSALRDVTYVNTSENPWSDDRTVTFEVIDDTGLAADDIRTVTVARVNDLPTVTPDSGTVTHTEGGSATAVAGDAVVSDPESDISFMRLTISSGHQIGDSLTFAPTIGITGTYDTGTGTLTLGASSIGGASPAQYQEALRTVTFTTTADNPGTARTITIVALANGGVEGPAATRTVTITPTNDAPTVTTSSGSVGFTERDAALVVDSGITVADPDDTDLTRATVKVITNHDPGSDVLDVTPASDITVDSWDPTTGTLVLTGDATVAEYEAVLRTVTFRAAGDAPGAGTRTISFTVTDGDATSTAGTRSVTVTAVNDAPVNTVPDAQSTDEDVSLTFNGARTISVADPDAGSGELEVTLTVTGGTFTLAHTTGLTFDTGDGSADATATFTGTLADLNAALAGLVYAPTANASGAGQLTIATDDQGNTGGTAETDTDTVAVTVVAVNDPTVVHVPATQVMDEDGGSIVFSAATGNAITFTDVDLPPGDVITVRLDLQDRGTWTRPGTSGPIVLDPNLQYNDFTGTLAELEATFDGFAFTPILNDNGDQYSRASFWVLIGPGPNDRDNVNSGTVFIDVIAVNDAPVVTAPTSVVADGGFLEFSPSNGNAISIVDEDSGQTPVTIELTASDGVVYLRWSLNLVVTGDGTDHVTATGSAQWINEALLGLTYQHDSEDPGTLTVAVNDNGHEGAGGAKTDVAVIDITYSN